MHLLDIKKLNSLLQTIGLLHFFDLVIARIEKDYRQWETFFKLPRHASHVKDGVIELMPIYDDEFYAMKYVNGHPLNIASGMPCVMGVGLLSQVSTGCPVLFAEMTLLTAIRTACTSAVAAKYAANRKSNSFAIIGTGAQAEFQILAFSRLFSLERIHCFDIDNKAVHKTIKNLSRYDFNITHCSSIESCIDGMDIVTTATARKDNVVLIEDPSLVSGAHINAIGGDCPGKTEHDLSILRPNSIIVEYLPQSQIEGEIQLYKDIEVKELHKIISGTQVARSAKDEVTFFDSVGFAIEDYSILRVIYDLITQESTSPSLDFIPDLTDPKDLFSLIHNVE